MKVNKITLKKQINLLKSAIWMKCLDCTNCQPKEIFLCETKMCPLWGNRPFEARGLYTLIKQLKQKNQSLYEANKS